MNILIIDDETVNVELLNDYLSSEGYETISAENGLEGFEVLKRENNIDLILLDRTMPMMGGVEFMLKMKEYPEFSHIPIIMQTAISDHNSMAEGIDAGAYYYLTKPYKKNVLVSIVNSALSDAKYKKRIVEKMHRNTKMLGLLNQAAFEFRTMAEAQNLAYFVANSFPDSERVILGLSELLINAIEHGNLGIDYSLKSKLMMNGKLDDELAIRAALPENKEKKAQLFFKKTPDKIKVIIKDEGKGFNWNEFLEMSPDRATNPNGRGIVMAKKMSFDHLEYRGTGSEVYCFVNTKPN